MKGLFLVISCMLCMSAFTSLLQADEIHLKNNTVIKGRVIQSDAASIKYTPDGGKKPEILPVEQVYRIVYDNGAVQNLSADEKTGTEAGGQEKAQGLYYPMLGVTLGTPAMLNLLAGYNINRVAFLVSGMYFPMSNSYGAQWAALLHVFHVTECFASISIIGGWTNIYIRTLNRTIPYYRYNGLGFNFSFYDFYAQIGFSMGVRKLYDEVRRVRSVEWQVGYLHRFNTSGSSMW
jgi:hypothetical protein